MTGKLIRSLGLDVLAGILSNHRGIPMGTWSIVSKGICMEAINL